MPFFLRATNLYFVENKVEKVVTNEEGTNKLPGNLMTTLKQIIFYVPCSMLLLINIKKKIFLKRMQKTSTMAEVDPRYLSTSFNLCIVH